MRIARVRHEGQTYLARLEDQEVVLLASEADHPAADALREALACGLDFAGPGTAIAPAGSVHLLSPVAHPGKFLAIGQNYLEHARESGAEAAPAPIAFIKAVTSISGPDDAVSFRKDQSSQVDYEGELAVVIGRRARDVAEHDAGEHIFGYTICNDVSARDAQFADGQWARGKSFDTFGPLGPWIVTAGSVPNVQALSVRTWVNGNMLQDGNTKDMIFSVSNIISYLSRFMTLEPGDVIATGTPSGVGFSRTPPVFLADGDIVHIEIEGIGRLSNPVRLNPDRSDRATAAQRSDLPPVTSR